MKTEITIRFAAEPDFAQLGLMMFDSVRNGPSPYTEEQRQAWLPEPHHGETWTDRLQNQLIVMAESEGEALGMMSLTNDDYIDLAFIRPQAQGTGLFRQLYRNVEQAAINRGSTELTVDASLSARPAFQAMGFATDAEETVEVRGQTLIRFKMSKELTNVSGLK